MTSPSIKEALEPCPFCNTAPAFGRMIEPDQVTIGCNNDDCLVQLCVVSDAESEAVKAWNTRATFQPDGERREAIARALSDKWPGDYMQGDDECEREPNALAYETADLILASGLVQDEAGIRADEREKCAKIAETYRRKVVWRDMKEATFDPAGRWEGGAVYDAPTIQSGIAAAIRSARDGGAS